MIVESIIIPFLLNLNAFVWLVFGTIFLIFLESKVGARIQHRDGSGQSNKEKFMEEVREIRKALRIEVAKVADLSVREIIILVFWIVAPVTAFLLVFGRIAPQSSSSSGILILGLTYALSLFLENSISVATCDSRNLAKVRDSTPVRLVGLLSFLVSLLGLSLRSDGSGFQDISEAQGTHFLIQFISAAGPFFLGISSFLAVFILGNSGIQKADGELSYGGLGQFFAFFVGKMWIFVFLAVWVFCFLGGNQFVLPFFSFPIKLFFTLIIYVFLENGVPHLRIVDSPRLILKWLLPASIFGIVLEASSLIW